MSRLAELEIFFRRLTGQPVQTIEKPNLDHDQMVNRLVEAARRSGKAVKIITPYQPGGPSYDAMEKILSDPAITAELNVVISFPPGFPFDQTVISNLKRLLYTAQSRGNAEIRTIGLPTS